MLVRSSNDSNMRGNALKDIVVDLKSLRLKIKQYYAPGNLLYELSIPRETLKKQPRLKAC